MMAHFNLKCGKSAHPYSISTACQREQLSRLPERADENGTDLKLNQKISQLLHSDFVPQYPNIQKKENWVMIKFDMILSYQMTCQIL